ncbi:uncharacterized protein ColSpa_03851 [Colletotrichum spaethianum]|uniref:Uncharacterized protein n=1 Tax=Colletotrichum spaethianum TaxID=700344 RepID=A0AA37NYR3_9PEZI|nr:uncharacterized protein ColSpa_03851 [Colletotrichum spaethianum]GKT43670.1 hypothetical protein ColSpa_03851 [Colletotrichum spaethianum]
MSRKSFSSIVSSQNLPGVGSGESVRAKGTRRVAALMRGFTYRRQEGKASGFCPFYQIISVRGA